MKSHFKLKDQNGHESTYELTSSGEVIAPPLTYLNMVKPISQLPIQFDQVGTSINAVNMQLESLKGFPRKVGNVVVSQNKIRNLTYCTPFLNWLLVDHNQLTNLEGDLRAATLLDVRHNPIESFKGIEHMWVGEIRVTWHEQLPLLRLLMCEKVSLFSPDDTPAPHVQQVNQILNKYVGQGKRVMLHCALELKNAGFDGNAKW